VEALYAVPGNPGAAGLATPIAADTQNPAEIVRVAESVGADLTVVGPEAPLVAGVVDALRAAGRAVVGPVAAAAQLEGSKIFAKEFMLRAGIPTAEYVTVDTEADALKALDRFGIPVVLKRTAWPREKASSWRRAARGRSRGPRSGLPANWWAPRDRAW